jgi:tetratricopeptide (TPR) repeat protein
VTRGAGAHYTYELSPQTLAFARRLAKEAQGGEVLLGGAVYRVARAEWNFEELATIDLDDTTDPGEHADAPKKAKIYRLRGIKEREQRMRERTAEGPLVGRELERKALKDAYREVVRLRRKHHVLIIGEEGVGKRSLISGFLQSLPSGEAMVLRAACRAATSDTPFSVVADLSRDMLGLAEGAEPREVKRRLQAAATMLYPAASESRDVQGLVDTVGMLLGIKVASDEIDAQERATRILQALRRIEERLAKDQPVVVIVEDVHWADSQSWDVFLHLINEPAQRTVLGLATARPDDRILHAATEAGNIMTLVLDELGPEDRLRLVAERFAPGEDVRALSEEIVAKAGGNPFYILELIDSLVERGTVAESRDHPGKLALLKRDVHLQAPTSVQALVATRLDRLPYSEKEVLLVASVIGREFAAGDLEALLGRGVDDDLRGLLRRQLVERRGGGHAFRNEMTQQVAYELLPPETQTRLHRRVADRMASSPGYRAGQDDAVLARHLERAGDGEAAAQRYLAAALHARDVLGNAEAFQHLSKALALLGRDAHADRLRARGERETILRAWGHRAQQLRELHQMRREAEALGDPATIADVLSRTAQFYLDVDKTPQAQRVLGLALSAARASGRRLVEAEVLRIQGVLARSLGENEEALALLDRALALCGDDRDGLLQRGMILNNKGTTLWQMSRLREAIEAHAEALVIYRKLRVPRQEAKVLNNIGIVFSALGEYEEALAHYKRSLKIDQELGNRLAVAVKLANIGGLYVDVGELDKAEPYLAKALAIAGELGDPSTQTDATITLGQVYLKRGDLPRARRAFEKGHTQAAQGKNRYQEIRGLVYLALASVGGGDPPERALALAREATDLAGKARIPIGQMYGFIAQGLALGDLGRHAESVDVGRRAVELLEGSHAPEGAEEILYHYGRILLAAGRKDDAGATLRRARERLLAKARRIKDPTLRARFLAASPARDILAEVGYHEPA